ncbi:MAG: hybrid sensor histidine kinase/response regulator [Natronospirillum sp.]|uniref:PAS domain-containing hybrid sensor histidine kinase/response regulator n=1 Tax=Natronospirillum sp. TaxID=2812955 RepID=UPI0025E359D4|nr:PAS domain-containing hybrid sensor histidine kinase/response regulator [Natronospirillum sp.]MCH8550980.1 hybrid sensor histidine kinase/response regulator [Natronospirillum sp.]
MTLLLILAALAYIALLFAVASWGDRAGSLGQRWSHHSWVYGLSIAIYCTSWTYYGAVGNAATSGWTFLPILLGPMLLFLFGQRLLIKLVTVSKEQNINSIADFIASRYGKRQGLALTVTILAAAAIIPYVALQLKAVAVSFSAASGNPMLGSEYSLVELLVAFLMAIFAMLFGTRRVDVTQYRSGMMLAVAFESTVKLFALLLAAAFAWVLLGQGSAQSTVATLRELDLNPGWGGATWVTSTFMIQMFMAAGAILCLPRQFHVMVVENGAIEHLKTARWLFPLYLVLTSLAIMVLAVASEALLPGFADRSMTALQLPLEQGQFWLMLVVYIGGISAATAMVIVATVTLSTMISNDVVMPMLLQGRTNPLPRAHRFQRRLLLIRRAAILVILLLGWLCYHLWTAQMDLVSIGLLAFSLVLQLLPPMLGGLYWMRGHARGVYWGLGLGTLTWVLVVLWPLIMDTGASADQLISQGTMISLLVNVVAYVVGSWQATHALTDRIQATAFVQPSAQLPQQADTADHRLRNEDLQLLLVTFLGRERAHQLIESFEHSERITLRRPERAEPAFIDYVEKSIAGVLGAATARSLIRAALADEQLNLEQVVHFFDDTTQALQTQQSILFSSLENLDQGISVVDADLRLAAWNRRYLEMFPYPDGLVQPGRHVSELIRYNAERGECGVGEVEDLINKRLRFMEAGSPHRFIRRRSDGRVIEMVGNPLPSGGFVTSFTDITEHIETQQALKDANIDLQQRIRTRTDEVKEINRELSEEIERRRQTEIELQQAKAEAESANASKTRFLALASHDILQPLNAARLYLSALDTEQLDDRNRQLTEKLDSALDSTENLMSTLLSIAKMEQGAMVPQYRSVRLNEILEPLVSEYSLLSERRGLRFRAHLLDDVVVHTDATYLRRIVQNFVSNAVKYTEEGGVLLGVRRRSHDNAILISVWDTGPGISPQQQSRVFDAFIRLHQSGVSGVGLGLAVAQRMGEQLDTPITLNSREGRGSCFTVRVPLGNPADTETRAAAGSSHDALDHLTIVCVDDEAENLSALSALLDRWDCQVHCFLTAEDALVWAETHEAPSLLLLDYQLGSDMDGLQLGQALRERWQHNIPTALVTAMHDPELKKSARAQGVQVLNKPVKPGNLRALLRHVAVQVSRDTLRQ